jgi:hypothetical protein
VRRLLLIVFVVAVGAAVLGARSTDTPFPDEPSGTATQPRTPERPAPKAVRCPQDAEACRAVRGRVIFVERVDPDGDGDLHVVLASGGITAPGITAVDVRPGLRPSRDPRVGNVASAAGLVQQGSYGQRQVHALRFRVHR